MAKRFANRAGERFLKALRAYRSGTGKSKQKTLRIKQL